MQYIGHLVDSVQHIIIKRSLVGLSATREVIATPRYISKKGACIGDRRLLDDPKNIPATSLHLSFFNVQYTYLIS